MSNDLIEETGSFPQQAEDKPKQHKPLIRVVITIDGEEKADLELETLFLIGIHKDGIHKDGADMARAICGNYGPINAMCIRDSAEKGLAECCKYPIIDMLTGMKGGSLFGL